MSYIYIYIYGAPILDVSRSHTTTTHRCILIDYFNNFDFSKH